MTAKANSQPVPASVTHSAKYRFDPAELPELLGIKVPDGGTTTVTHVSNTSERVTAFASGTQLVVTVTWESGPDGGS